MMDNTTEDVQVLYNIFTTLMSKLSYTGLDKLISKFTFSSNLRVPAQQTHDAITTSLLRRNDVATSFPRYNDVIITSRVHWDFYSTYLQIIYK